jgi:hypothetical protein
MINETTKDESTTVTTWKTLCSRGRVYLNEYERDELQIDDPHGTMVDVTVQKPLTYDGESGWVQRVKAGGRVTLCEYGEFTIPIAIREKFDVEVGDEVIVEMER